MERLKGGKVRISESELKERLGDDYKPSIRDFGTTLFIGSQGAGKSDLMSKMAVKYEEKNDCKVLVLDVAGARSFRDFPIITLEEFKADSRRNNNNPIKWRNGIRRMTISIDNQKEYMDEIAQRFVNGLLVIDEGNQLIKRSGDVPEWLSKVFRQCRNNAIDVWCALHSFVDIHINIRGHVKSIVMWDAPDNAESPKYFEDLKYEQDWKELFDLYQQVKSQKYMANNIKQPFRVWYSKKFKAQIEAQRKSKL